jgi:hypothetical protein
MLLASALSSAAVQAQNYDPYYGRDDYRYANGGYDDRYGDPYDRNGGRVRCESRDRRTQLCGVDTRGGVRMVRQLSDRRCERGRTWGTDGRGIWVTDGCRAEFELGTGYGATAGVFRCESNNNRTRYCNVDTRYGVRLLTQHSRSACIEGRTWGWDPRGIWVANGCRAQFQVGQRRGDERYRYGDGRYGDDRYGDERYGYGDLPARRVTCQSQDSRYNFCRVSGYIRQAQIQRQLSSSQCQYNYSWGYRSDGIWVDRGCRAEFVVAR